MPLNLDNPLQVAITTVKITNFSVVAEPLSVTISFVRGYETPAGFSAIDSGSASFDAEQIAAVDPTGQTYLAMKDALYELLETVVGDGTIT